MSSFLDKLKKNMEFEETSEEATSSIEKRSVKFEEQKTSVELELKKKPLEQTTKEVKEIKKIKVENEKPSDPESLVNPKSMNNKKNLKAEKEKWFKKEGQLTIDVYQTETDLIIQTAIAGVSPDDLEITMERDIVIIKGIREKPFNEKKDYFIQECYWGPFSRKIILPVEIDPNRTEAIMQEGILTIRMPKTLKDKKRRIEIRT